MGNDTINPGQGEYDDIDGGEGADLLILDYSSITFPETETHIEGLYFEASDVERVGSEET